MTVQHFILLYKQNSNPTLATLKGKLSRIIIMKCSCMNWWLCVRNWEVGWRNLWPSCETIKIKRFNLARILWHITIRLVPHIMIRLVPHIMIRLVPHIMIRLVPHIMIRLVPHIMIRLVPHIMIRLVPHITIRLVPHIMIRLVPHITIRLVPHIMIRLVPHIMIRLVPHITIRLVPHRISPHSATFLPHLLELQNCNGVFAVMKMAPCEWKF